MISLTGYQRKELVYKFLALEIWLNRMLKEGNITKKQEREIRLKFKPLRYVVYLSSPEFQNNKKLKKEANLLCLNDLGRFIGFGKSIRYINCEDST